MLWGLLGLAVPVTIHLLHKRSSRVLMVGSLKTFRGGSPVQARSLKPNELWLLLLRCLLLTILVLLLCQPVLLHEDDEQLNYLFIAPELATQTNIDSLIAIGYEPHLLQPGLPLLDENALPDSSSFSYWDVFREIDKLEDAGDTVWLQLYPWLNCFTGDRPALTKTFVQLPVPEAIVKQPLAQVLKTSDTQLIVSYWQEAAGVWRLQNEVVNIADTAKLREESISNVRPKLPDTLNVVLQHPAEEAAEALMWQTSLQLIDSMQPALVMQLSVISGTDNQIPGEADVWVWLSKEEPPAAFIQADRIRRFMFSDGNGLGWFSESRQVQGPVKVWKSLLEEQNNRVQLARFIPELMAVLPIRSSLSPPPVLLAEDQWQPSLWQPLLWQPRLWQSQQRSYLATAGEQVGNPLENYLWIALVFVFIIERWLSLRK
jgi:hypothetical protein